MLTDLQNEQIHGRMHVSLHLIIFTLPKRLCGTELEIMCSGDVFRGGSESTTMGAGETAWVRIPAPLMAVRPWVKLLNLSVPQVLICKMGGVTVPHWIVMKVN